MLWVWGDRETGQAEDCGLAKDALSGMLSTLEKGGLVARRRHPHHRRRVEVHLLAGGRRLIEEVFPRFNAYEAELTSVLGAEQCRELSRLLRPVTATADGVPLVPESPLAADRIRWVANDSRGGAHG